MLDPDLIQKAFGLTPPKSPDLIQFARADAESLGLDPDIAAARIIQESGGRSDAVSPKGAFGPAQLMPDTARELARRYRLDPTDPQQNIMLGNRYHKELRDQFGSDELALAAYHAGPGAVQKAGGIPNTNDGLIQTSGYVQNIMARAGKKPGLDEAPPPAMDPTEAALQSWLDTHKGASYSDQAPPQPQTGNFTRGVKVAAGQMKPLAMGALGALGAVGEQAFGTGGAWEDLKEWGLKGAQDGLAKLTPLSRENDDVTVAFAKARDKGDYGAMLDWLEYTAGYGAVQLGAAALTGGLGSIVGKAAGKAAVEAALKGTVARATEKLAAKMVAEQVAKGLAKDAAETLVAQQVASGAIRKLAVSNIASAFGAAAALQLYSQTQEIGSIYPEAVAEAARQNREMTGTDVARVMGYGVVSGAVEGLTDLLGLGVVTGKIGLPGIGGRFARGATGAAIGAVTEGPLEEGAQTWLEWKGAGKDTGSEGFLNDLINSMAAGAVPGGFVGGFAGAVHGPQKSIQRDPVTDGADVAGQPTAADAIEAATAVTGINSDANREAVGELLRQQWEMRNAAQEEEAIRTAAEARLEAQSAQEEEAVRAQVRQEQAVKEAPQPAQYETVMRAIEERDGKATHAEAALLARAGQGAPYDSIIEAPVVAGKPLSEISESRLEELQKLAGKSETAARIGDELAIRRAGQIAEDITAARASGLAADRTGTVQFSGQRDQVDHQEMVNLHVAQKYGVTAKIVPSEAVPETMSPREYADLKLAANLVGKDLVLYTVDGKSSDGFVETTKAPNTIYMNAAPKDASPTAVLWHEISHHMAQDDPETYSALKQALREEGVLKGTTTEFFATRPGMSEAAQFEEVVGDLTGNAMTQPEVWHGVFNRIGDIKVVRKIAEYVKRMLGHFIRHSNLKQFEDTGRLVNDVRKVQKAVSDAVARYVEKKGQPDETQTDRNQRPAGTAEKNRSSAQRTAPPYGKVSPLAVSVVGTHFSGAERTHLSGRFFGSGLKGAEHSRLDNAPEILKNRLYFYVDEGSGVSPEEGLGSYAHSTQLNNLYDAAGDPLNLWNSKDNNAAEMAILRAGFDGYYVRGVFGSQGVAVLIGEHLEVPTLKVGEGPQESSGQVAPPVVTNPARAMASRLALSRALPDGEMDGPAWSRMLQALDPEIFQALNERGAFDQPGRFYKSELAAQLLRPAPIQESRQRYVPEFGELSTRMPKQVPGTGVILLSDFKSMKLEPDKFEKNINLVASTLVYREADSANTVEKRAERFIQTITKNILWLYDQYPEQLRARAKLWYDGGHRLVADASRRYGITMEQAAAVYAVMSPQLDWFRNIDLGNRIMGTWFDHRNHAWTPEMTAVAEELFFEDQVFDITGRSLADQETDIDRARWVRVFDEAYTPREYNVMSPEGDVLGPARTVTGALARAGWQNGAVPMAKAISVLENGSLDNISRALGQKHKVRNFYNNLLTPNSPNGYVTVDTHAVAAAHLLPFSGNSQVVEWNFGKTGSTSPSAASGLTGTYPLYLEAYTRAAKQRDMLPRELQSVVWEAVRGLFKPQYKTNQNAVMATNDTWLQYKKGRLSLENARQRILTLAGGIDPPAWAGPSDTAYATAEDSTDIRPLPTGSLREADTPGGIQPRESAQRALFEVAPNPDDREAYGAWGRLSSDQQLEISRNIADAIVPRVLAAFGARGYVTPQIGGYEGTHNVSFALHVDEGDVDKLSKALGYVLAQKSMVTIGGKEGDRVGAVIVTIPDATFTSVSGVYERLWRGARIIGHTTTGDQMVIINSDVTPLSKLEADVRRILGNDFDITTDPEVSASFPDNYEIEKQPPLRRQMLDGLRKEANDMLSMVGVPNIVESAQRDMFQKEIVGRGHSVRVEKAVSSRGAKASVRLGNENSEGKVITHSRVGHLNFWRWYGDGPVDSKGRPIVLYHSTNSDFLEFKTGQESINDYGILGPVPVSRAGLFATPDSHFSQEYLKPEAGGRVLPIYMALQNPLDLSEGLSEQDEATLEAAGISTAYLHNTRDAWELFDNDGDGTNTFVEALKRAGFDGAVFREDSPTGATKGGTTYVAFSPAQIKSAVGNRGTFDPQSPNITESAQRGLYQQPHLNHLNQAQRDMIEHVVGRPLTWRERIQRMSANAGIKLAQGIADQFAPIKDYSYHAYMQARLSKASDGTLEAALLHGVPSLQGDVFHIDTRKGGFLERLKALKGEQDLFFLWIAGQRAEELTALGRENLFRRQDIIAAKSLNQGNMADGTPRAIAYDRAHKDLLEYQKAVLDIAEARGIIDGDSRHVWESQFYVPFYRNMEDGTTGPSIKSGLVNQYAFKKLKGSSRQLNEDLMANTLMNWAHLLSAAAKNVAAKETIETAEKIGVAYPVPANVKGAVAYLENGEERHFRIEDPFLLDAVSALSFGSFNDPLSKLMGRMKHFLTMGVTAMPQFKIRNLIRDSISSIAQTDLSYNIVGNVIQGMKAANPKHQAYIDMLANGGVIRFGAMLDGNRAGYTRRLLEKGIPADSILDTARKVEGFFTDIWSKYQEFGDMTENANRAALFQQLRAKGVGELEANFQARDLLDFSMSGSWKAIRYLSQITPFFNARIQGLYKLGREAKENPAKMAVVLGATVVASMALLAAYSDDDDWKKREDWDRDNYWWFKFGDQAYRIPKPFELGAIATLVERTWELMSDQEMDGRRFGERVGSLLSNNLSLVQLPQLIKPIVDAYANKDSFTGRQIESAGLENLPASARKTERTSGVAELLGELGLPNPVAGLQGQYDPLSPVKIDFLIRGYFGGLGTSLLAAVDMAANPFRDKPPAPEPQLRDVFLIGSFTETLPTGSSRYVTHLYEQAKAVNEAYALYQSRLKVGDLEGAQAIMAEKGPEIMRHKSISKITRMMTELNQQIRVINASRELTPQGKRALIDEIRARQDQLARLAQPTG